MTNERTNRLSSLPRRVPANRSDDRFPDNHLFDFTESGLWGQLLPYQVRRWKVSMRLMARPTDARTCMVAQLPWEVGLGNSSAIINFEDGEL